MPDSHRVREHLRSNVVGYIALFCFAIGGTAQAVDGPLPGTNQVGSADIINGDVKRDDIGSGEVLSGDIGDGTIGGGDIADDAVRGPDVKEGSLDFNVLQARLTSGCAGGQAIASISQAGSPTCVGSGGPPSGPAGGDLVGIYPNPTIKSGAIGSGKIADGSVQGIDILTDSIGSSDLGANSVNSSEITNGGVFAADIASSTITAAELALGSVGASEIADPAVGSSEVFDNSILGGDVLESSLDSSSFVTGWSDYDVSCDPNLPAANTADCNDVAITLPRSARLLVISTGSWFTDTFNDPNHDFDSPSTSHGDCQLLIDGANQAIQEIGEIRTNAADVAWTGGSDARSTLAITHVTTGLIAAGPHNVVLRCDEDDGDIMLEELHTSVVMLGTA